MDEVNLWVAERIGLIEKIQFFITILQNYYKL